MKLKIILCLALVLSGSSFDNIARADTAVYDSVEWLTAMADQIGVYHAERIYGPHSVTNDPQHWSCCFCTAEFKLQQALRGSPPATFSRTRQVEKPELLGFHSGDTYVFFFIAEERLKNVRSGVNSASEVFFSMWDYIWLERPLGERNGVAIDVKGSVLTNRSEILKRVEISLKLPRANPGINRWSYFYGSDTNKANFNFRVIDFPPPNASIGKESWPENSKSWTGLVIPENLHVAVEPFKTGVRVKETFKVALRVENPTQTNQTVRVMNCSWDEEWKTSNPKISWVSWNCAKNFAVSVVIPPGGAYTNELEMLVPEPISEKILSFRMGFTPIGCEEIFWSDEVKLNIIPPDIKPPDQNRK